MVFDSEKRVYHYPCPCGDRFEISRSQLANYEDVATCPSCSLIIRVIYDPVSYSLILILGESALIEDVAQLDFEDEDPDDEQGESESEGSDENEEEEEKEDSDKFEDALEKLHIAEVLSVTVAPIES